MENTYTLQLDNENYGITPVENIFLNLYMPEARGDYVKLYLYGLKQCQKGSGQPLNNVELSKLFNLTEGDVRLAWEYWEKQGIISVSYIGTREVQITYYNITAIMIDGKQNQKSKQTKSMSKQNQNDIEFKEMIDTIQALYGSRPLSKNEMLTFKKWIESYGFSPQTVVLLVEYALNLINQKSTPFGEAQILKYMSTIADSWYKEGVKTLTDANSYLAHNEQSTKRHYKVLKSLGIRRDPVVGERDMIDSWYETLNLPEELIDFALYHPNQPTIKYVNGILMSWYNAGYQSVEDVKQKDQKPFANQTNTSTVSTPEDKERDELYDAMEQQHDQWLREWGE